jgi:GNAT superfamily N-acetyltransferase
MPVSNSCRIRPATPDDAHAIARLLGVLGYPATADEIPPRLARLSDDTRAIAMVAQIDDDVVGVITGHVIDSIHDSLPVAWLTTLVVDDNRQGQGIGKALAEHVAEWARGQGAVRLSVTSGEHRAGAHAFYERLGYERRGIRLVKQLGT